MAEQGKKNDSIVLSVSSNLMEASLLIRGGEEVSEPDVLAAIKQDGRVAFGLDMEAVRRAVSVRDERVCIARGLEPVKGEDAVIDILFETEHNLKPKVLEDGSVDYKSLNVFETARKGQQLVRKTPATPGTPGMTVTGKPVAPKPGRDKPMPRGVNVAVSEDGLLMTAEAGGRVDYTNGKVVVSTRFEIGADADMSVGNTDFNGDILIKGGVISGLTIRGTGNVEIFGIVEGAHIEAGGDIILHQGMQGNDVGVLKAGGRVFAPFIERATVTAAGDVTADTLVHSNINSEGSVLALGKRGVIVGGVTRANVKVAARIVGSASCTPTLVEVGISPEQRLRMLELENQKQELVSIARKIEMRERSFTAVPAQADRERIHAVRIEVVRQKMINQKKLLETEAELSGLKAATEDAQSGRVHVLRTAFPGVQISIAPLRYLVSNETEYCTYKKSGDEIVFMACEYREGDDGG